MRIKASVGRAGKFVCIDNYVRSLQLWEDKPPDPFILAAIARALTGRASTLWLAMYEEAERCVEDQRKLTEKLLAKSLSKPASRLTRKQAVKLKACLASKHARRNSKKPTRRRST